jgi:prephenate dehydrogenase
MNALPASVAVFGPGLMGGSLLAALRARSPRTKLGAWARKSQAIEELKARGLIDFGATDAADVAHQTELAVLCLPVDRMEEIAGAIKDALPPGSVVTDVGSVKKSIVDALERIFTGDTSFVGSHPMCGSEEAGLAAARPDLYENALCVVTPTAQSRGAALQVVESLWRTAGARTAVMSPDEHDRAAAFVSHLPHVVAALLVETLSRENPKFHDLCAGGFRDTTRIAAGSPELWTAILSSNREDIVATLDRFGAALAEVRAMLNSGDKQAIHNFLEDAARHRAEIFPVT